MFLVRWMEYWRARFAGKTMNYRSICFACLALLILSVVAGCDTRGVKEYRGSSIKPFIPPGADRYEMEENQKFVIGAPVASLRLPTYPQATTLDRAIIVVCLEVSIDQGGHVYESKPLFALPGYPTSKNDTASEFINSAKQAAEGWRFQPSRLCTYPAGYNMASVTDDCGGPVTHIEPMAIKLAFRFRFTKGLRDHAVSIDRLLD